MNDAEVQLDQRWTVSLGRAFDVFDIGALLIVTRRRDIGDYAKGRERMDKTDQITRTFAMILTPIPEVDSLTIHIGYRIGSDEFGMMAVLQSKRPLQE